jgi:hypothetical protein
VDSERHVPHGIGKVLSGRSASPSRLVDGFWIDRTLVTNKQFRKFVNETGYVTVAETPPDPKDCPGALPHMLKAGSLVFTSPKHLVDLRYCSQWWKFKFGADWRRPYGPRSSIIGLDDHPVVHVAYRDAEAYAGWAGKERKRSGSLPRAVVSFPSLTFASEPRQLDTIVFNKSNAKIDLRKDCNWWICTWPIERNRRSTGF